jgi:hypothetical protein
MEECAYPSILRKYLQKHPGFKVAHVPPQLLCTWAMVAENEGAKSADDAMYNWCVELRSSLLDSISYVVFHWGHGHIAR